MVELSARVVRRGRGGAAYFVADTEVVDFHWELWKKNEANSRGLVRPWAMDENLADPGCVLQAGLYLRQTYDPSDIYDDIRPAITVNYGLNDGSERKHTRLGRANGGRSRRLR